jgi:hypothetical protein
LGSVLIIENAIHGDSPDNFSNIMVSDAFQSVLVAQEKDEQNMTIFPVFKNSNESCLEKYDDLEYTMKRLEDTHPSEVNKVRKLSQHMQDMLGTFNETCPDYAFISENFEERLGKIIVDGMKETVNFLKNTAIFLGENAIKATKMTLDAYIGLVFFCVGIGLFVGNATIEGIIRSFT